MKKIFLSLVLAGFYLFVSCQDIAPVEKPKDFISEKKMEEILYESVLLKSARGYGLGKITSVGIDPQNYVLEKFEIDSAQYAANVAYYSTQTEKYTAMNMRVKDRIVAVLKIEDSLDKMETKIKDSLRLKRARDNEEERLKRMKNDSLGINNNDSLQASQINQRRSIITPNDSL